MKKSLTGLILLILLSSACSRAFNLSNFETPESMQVDPETGSYYVSNVNGDPLEKDGNGYISKITANGNIVIQKFIGGKPENPVLHAPKGMAIAGSEIFVTDIDHVKAFDKESAKQTRDIDLSAWNVKFLNDMTQDRSGALFVSDMLTNRIFRLDPKAEFAPTIFKEGPELGGPNGLVFNPRSRNLMVVTWDSGQILELDPSGKIHVLKRGLKTLDGIDYDVEGNLYVSSFEKGEIYRIPFYGRGPLSTFMGGLVTPADIACDRKKHELLVPSFNGDIVNTFPLLQKRPSSELSSEKKQPDQKK